jgi:hypothetical protein
MKTKKEYHQIGYCCFKYCGENSAPFTVRLFKNRNGQYFVSLVPVGARKRKGGWGLYYLQQTKEMKSHEQQ